MVEKRRKEKFLNSFCGCWATFYPDKEPSELSIDIYYRALEKYPIEHIVAAFDMAIQKCRWFPKPVELIEFISGDNVPVEDRATKEAIRVIESIRRVGGYKSIQFDDPVTNAVIRTQGRSIHPTNPDLLSGR